MVVLLVWSKDSNLSLLDLLRCVVLNSALVRFELNTNINCLHIVDSFFVVFYSFFSTFGTILNRRLPSWSMLNSSLIYIIYLFIAI